MSNPEIDPATEERLRNMALDLEDQIIRKHDQAVREVTDYLVSKYYPNTTLEEKKQIAKNIVKSFDKLISTNYLDGTYIEFEYWINT